MRNPITVFLPSFGSGGVERMMVNLAQGMADLGQETDMVVRRATSPYLEDLSPDVRIVELEEIHRDPETAAAIYLENESPRAILSCKEENDILAVRSRRRSRSKARFIVRVPVHASSRLEHKGRGLIKKLMVHKRMKQVIAEADSIIAVSTGVAKDVSAITGIPLETIHIIRNPVVTTNLKELAEVRTGHGWFTQKSKPVILGMGRLGSQKNFEYLIRAFSLVREKLDSRLIILGEGRRRNRLERLIKNLGLSESVQLPGFVPNPYPFLANADIFVLSSLWEGSPNALVEALALGTPVVSTDCESGPREILKGGRFGELVPLGDVGELAAAIVRTLQNPAPAEFLVSAVEEYKLDSASRAYRDVLLGVSTINSPQRFPG